MNKYTVDPLAQNGNNGLVPKLCRSGMAPRPPFHSHPNVYKYSQMSPVYNTHNRLLYDKCAYEHRLYESTSPLAYNINPIAYESCSKCQMLYPGFLGSMGGFGFGVGPNEIDLESLREWNILSVMTSEDGKRKEIYISTDSIEGNVKEVFESTELKNFKLVIGDKDYKLSTAYLNSTKTIPAIGDEGTFYIDVEGKIVAFSKQVVSAGAGFLIKATINSKGVNKKLECKIFDSEGNMRVLKCADNITVDGENYTDIKDVIPRLKESTTNRIIKRQLINFEINEKGEIKTIDTPYSDTKPKGTNESEDSLYSFYGQTGGLIYKSGQKTFAGKVNITSDTVVFSVPADPNVPNLIITNPDISDPGSYLDYSGVNEPESTSYKIKDSSFFMNDETYVIEAYRNVKDALLADALIVRTGTGTTKLVTNTPFTVVSRITSGINEKGDIAYKLYGYRLGKEISYFVNDNDLVQNTNLKEGDVIDKLFDESTRRMWPSASGAARSNPSTSGYNASLRFLYGNVHSSYANVMRITVGEVTASDVENQLENYTMDTFKIYVYDSQAQSGKKISIGSMEDIISYKQSPRKYSKIFILTNYANAKDLVVYK